MFSNSFKKDITIPKIEIFITKSIMNEIFNFHRKFWLIDAAADDDMSDWTMAWRLDKIERVLFTFHQHLNFLEIRSADIVTWPTDIILIG